ncbi:MAG: two-component regulator propeller domain-containing protein, partial [Colwellia sp.]|nr:two-component regulator propeller domain-containing protein [Colwellia sp.]
MKFCKIVILTILMTSLSFIMQAKEKSTVQNLYLKQLSVEDGLSQGTVNSILADKRGFVWLATDNGLNIYDGYSIKQLPGPNNSFLDSIIHFVKQDTEGGVWINVNNALYRYQPGTNKYQLVLSNAPDADGHYVVDITQGKNSADKVGYWIATNKTIGFYDVEISQFKIKLDLSTKLLNQDNIFQLKYHRQILYIATRVGVFAYHSQHNTWKKLPDLTILPGSHKFTLYEATKSFTLHISAQNDLYVGTNDGVFSVNIENIKEYISGHVNLAPYKLILRNLSVFKFLFSDGKLYVASNRGLHSIDTKKYFGEFLFGVSDYLENTSDDQIISLAQDNHGIFWLGSESRGVYLWDPSRELIKNYRYQRNNENSLSDNAVWTVEQHNSNNDLIWVGTSNGLNLIDHQQNSLQRHLLASNVESQFGDNNIYQIYNYKEGLLLLTSRGVFLYNYLLNQLVIPDFNVEINQVLTNEISSVFLQQQRYLWLVQNDGSKLIDLQIGKQIDLTALNKVVPLTDIHHFLGSLPNSNATLFSTSDSLWSYDLATHDLVRLYQYPGILATEWLGFDNWAIDKNDVFWLSYPGKGLVGLKLSTFKAKYFYHSKNSIIDNNVYSLITDKEGDIWFSTHKGVFLLNSDNHHIRNFTIADGFPAMEFNAGARLQLTNGNLVYGSMEGVSIFDPLKLKKKHLANDLKVHVTNIDVISRKLDLPLIINQQQGIQLEHDDVGIRFDFSTLSYADNRHMIFEYQLTGDSNVRYPATTDNKIVFPSLPSGLHMLSVKAKSPVTGEYSSISKIKIRVSYAPWQSPLAYFIYAVILLLLTFFWLYQRNVQRLKLLKAHEEVTFRENRLQLALIGSNSEVWDWQAHDDLMFCKRIAQELDYIDLAKTHSFKQHVELIHPDDKEKFLSSWEAFVAQNSLEETFSCTYRLKHTAGHWLWYKDLGKIVTLDGDNKPSRITGSYTNITKTRAEEVRNQYYGEAFKQTNDWVLIINDNYTRAMANQSLCRV